MSEVSEVSEVLINAADIVEARIDHSSLISCKRCISAIGSSKPFVVFRFGTMYGGKTDGTLMDVINLRRLNITVHVFKLLGDNRYNTTQTSVASKTGRIEKAIGVESIVDICAKIESGEIKSGEVVAIIEMPFLCPDVETLNRFIGLIKQNNIIVIADGLGYWFNTQPLDIVREILTNSDLAFYMQAYNSFNPGTLAEATLRCVRIVQVGGKFVVVDDDDRYYKSLTQDTLERLVYTFQESRFYIKGITGSTVIDQTGIALITYLPSHPSDKLFAIGGPERYIPISLEDMIEMYSIMGIELIPFHPNDLYCNKNIVFEWDNVGL